MLVELDAALGALNRADLAAQPFHLRIASDARLHAVPSGIAADRFVIKAVADHHFGTMGPRSYQRHAPLQNIEQLRQLVDAEPAQDSARRSDALIVFRRRLP